MEKKTRKDEALKYVGDGSWLPGVPARDLTAEEAKVWGVTWLLETGLYELMEEH